MRASSNIAAMADMESPRQMFQARQIGHLDRINRVLGWACVILATGLFVYYFFSPQKVFLSHKPLSTPAGQAVGSNLKVFTTNPSSDGQTTSIKNLFEPVLSGVQAQDSDFSSQYKVVGIILDRNPQAVLQDKQLGKSVFVHKGDRLNDAVVDDIQDGKVILSVNGKSQELMP